MDTKTLTQEISDWAVEVCPEIAEAYAFATDERAGLPDVAVEITSTYMQDFPVQDGRLRMLQQVEQTRTRVWEVDLWILVPPEPAEVADSLLKDFTDRLIEDIATGTKLRDRVSWVNDTPRASFRPPFVEFDDGTRGRVVTLSLQVGQSVEVG